MRTFLIGFFLLLALQKTALAQVTSGVTSTEGGLDYVVCIPGTSLNVRDQSLANVLFTVAKYDSALLVQSFGTDKLQKTINGVTYTFIKVQFPNRTSTLNTGWVAEDYIKLRSQCAGATPVATAVSSTSTRWTFPTLRRPTDSYRTGMRRFQASRSGGTRYHAACDLYRTHGEQAVAVNTGKVIRNRYYFYEGTYAIEIKHSDGKVVRYGEITGKAASGVYLGSSVATGQTVGYIGTVSSGCCKPMLHFEMYSGTATGPLTQGGNMFSRRSDLMNPTEYLAKWELLKFGQSY